MKRPLKYPTAAMVGATCGHASATSYPPQQTQASAPSDEDLDGLPF